MLIKHVDPMLCITQEVWKVSTTAGLKRVKKASSVSDTSGFNVSKESDGSSRLSASGVPSMSASTHADSAQVSLFVVCPVDF